jgi:hypothetical protein
MAKPHKFTDAAAHAAYCRAQALEFLAAGRLNSAVSSVIANLKQGPFRPTPATKNQLVREAPTLAEMKDVSAIRKIILAVTSAPP